MSASADQGQPTDAKSSVHVLPARGATSAVVLLLHGGTDHSFEPLPPRHLPDLRMRPFARALRRKGGGHGVAVWRLRYRVRGWNGSARSPVADARWALEEIRRRHGSVRVVLVGHSMGGRTAVHVLDDPSVTAMVGLAPWLPHDPVEGATGKDVLVAHGIGDRVTSPAETLRWAELARPLARSLGYVQVRRSGHTLLRRSRVWTDLTVGFALRSLGLDPAIGATARAALEQAADGILPVTV